MKRPVTITAFGLAAAFSYGLYQLSYEMQAMERRLGELDRTLAADQEEIRVLGAEWAYLTRPESLQRLAARHLDLVPISPRQVVARLTDLPMRAASALAASRVPLPLPRPTTLTAGEQR